MRTRKDTMAYFFFFSVILAAYFHIALSGNACAWSNDPNVNTPICNATQNQQIPQITSDGSGGAIIAWEDKRSTTTDCDIYARRINASGTAKWTANGVAICTASDDQHAPQITTDCSHGAIIAWKDHRSGNDDIYAQRIDALGTPKEVSALFESHRQIAPQIISDGSGGAIITWEDHRNGNADIYARRINASGFPQWSTSGLPICTASYHQSNPQIISDGSGGAIIAWEDHRNGNADIYAQLVNASGTPQWTANGVVICTANGDQLVLQITTDCSNGAIITWEDWRSGKGDIYAQLVNVSGTPQWTANGVAICTASGSQLYPQIISDGSGGAIITWQDDRWATITGWDIYLQLVNVSGTPQWTANGKAICTAGNDQYAPQITTDGSGGAIIAWEDERSTTTDCDIYARRIDASGTRQWRANGVAICTAGNDQYAPQITTDGSGGAIIAWQDYRNGNADIYAQQIAMDGTLGKTYRSLPFLPLLLLE